MELGPHGSGHNLELLLNNKGEFEIFILDAHAENYVRIAQSTIELNLADNNRTLTLNAIPDPATGETVAQVAGRQFLGRYWSIAMISDPRIPAIALVT